MGDAKIAHLPRDSRAKERFFDRLRRPKLRHILSLSSSRPCGCKRHVLSPARGSNAELESGTNVVRSDCFGIHSVKGGDKRRMNVLGRNSNATE